MVETMTDRLTEAWARTDRIFEILAPGAWLAQPIALRHPFIFYLGHLPAFAWKSSMTLLFQSAIPTQIHSRSRLFHALGSVT